jgi:hypothetical protein
LVADGDVRAQVSEYVKKWEDEKKPASPPEIKTVPKRDNRANSQELLSPPPNARKRSRSPTPGDDLSRKKVPDAEEKPSQISKSPQPPRPATVANDQFDPFNQPFNNMPPFMPGMPGMPGMPFPPFPPDPFMMAAMGFPPPPIPAMMPGMPPMEPGMFPYNQQMGDQMYGGHNNAYMRRPVNDRVMRRVQNNSGARNSEGREQGGQ